MDKSLLLNQSIFDGSNLIDHIRQFCIDINEDFDQEIAQTLVNESINYLNTDITVDLSNEIFSLIYACFLRSPEYLLPVFNTIFPKSRKNSNFIIIISTILAYYIHNHPNLELPDYKSFVNDAINELRPQIKDIDNKSIFIFSHEIPSQFKLKLIINLLLCTKLTEETISDFIPYIFTSDHISDNYEFTLLIKEISKEGLIPTFPSSILTNFDIITKFQLENLIYFIPYLSDQIFNQIFPILLDNKINKINNLNSTFVKNYIERCSQLNLQISDISKMVNFLEPTDFSTQICMILNQYQFEFSEEKAKQLANIPDLYLLLDKLPSLSFLPIEILLEVFQKKTKISIKNHSSSEFYNEIYSHFNNNEILSEKLIELIAIIFSNFIQKEKVNQILDEMIFSFYPPTKFGSTFLFSFLHNIKDEYYNLFNSNEHMNEFINKILEKKIIPNMKFIDIIDSSALFQMAQKNQNPLLLHIYRSKNLNELNLEEITVLPMNDQPNEILINFINNYDLNSIEKLNENCLSLVSSALIYLYQNKKPVIKGLTKETILLFYSIIAKEVEKTKKRYLKDLSPEMTYLLIEGIKLVPNNQSPNIILLINTILESLEFNSDVKNQFLPILHQSLLKGEYFADKKILLHSIVGFNNTNYQYDKVEIIEYIFNHVSEIDVRSQAFVTFGINSEENSKIAKLFMNYFQDPSLPRKDLFSIMFIIQVYFLDKIEIEFENPQKLFQLYEELVNEKNWTDFKLVYDFLNDYGFSEKVYEKVKNDERIPSEIKSNMFLLYSIDYLNANDYISIILNLKSRINNEHFYIFNKMMKGEKINRIGYILSTLEELSHLNLKHLKPSQILNYVDEDIYNNYTSDFFESLDHIFVFNPIENVFVIRPEYKILENINSEHNQIVISNLFEMIEANPEKYQALICLKNIASTFPFILNSYSQKIFDLTHPILDNFYLLFESNLDENKIIQAKISISAFSFLYSSLNSTKIIDDFLVWFFSNYKTFSNSQLYCYSLILLVLMKNYAKVTSIILLDNNVFDMFSFMLQKEIPIGSFNNNYFNNIYKLIYTFCDFMFKPNNGFYIFCESFLNIGYNFSIIFNNHLTIALNQSFFKKFNFIRFPPDFNKELNDLIEDIEFSWSFWLADDSKKDDIDEKIDEKRINSFINQYKSSVNIENEIIDDSPIPEVPGLPTYKMIRYLAKKPLWVNLYVTRNEIFTILPGHRKILKEVIEKLNIISKTGKLDDDDDKVEDHTFTENYQLMSLYKMYNENFLNLILERVELEKTSTSLYLMSLIQKLSFNIYNATYLLSVISSQIDLPRKLDCINDEIIFKINRINDILTAISKSNINNNFDQFDFISTFFHVCGNKFIDLILQPQIRSNTKILDTCFNLFNIFPYSKLPIRVTHIIAFMILSKNEKIIENAIQLCEKFSFDQLKHLDILQNVFDDELNKENPNLDIIFKFLKFVPSVGRSRIKTLMDLLEEFINEYSIKYYKNASKNTNSSNNNENMNSNNSNENANSNNSDENINSNNYENADQDDDSPISEKEEEEEEEHEEEEEYDEEENQLIEKIANLLDFLTPERKSDESFIMSDSILINQQQQQQNKNYIFYPIPSHIYESSPFFWKFFDKHRSLIDHILLKKFKQNEMINPYENDFSQFQNPTFSSKLVTNYPECFSFQFKSTYFHQKMQSRIIFSGITDLKIDSKNILKSSFDQLFQLPIEKWLSLFNVIYIDQPGVDQGGLTKDLFTQLSKEIFNPKSELFECMETNDNYNIKSSKCDQISLQMYKFTGMIIAKALIQGELFSAHLTRSLLKLILHQEVKLSDLEDADQILYKSYIECLNSDITSIQFYEPYFVVDNGSSDPIPLIENGENIKVTNENKRDYFELMAKYRLKNSIINQVTAFCDGFDSLIPHEDIRIFTPNELSLLICGFPKIDVDDLMKYANYEFPYSAESATVKMFFNVIKKWDNDHLSKLLMFITSSSRMPAAGFKYFADKNLPITIQPGGSRDRLPVAHTCTNTIDLPEYESEDEMNQKLLIAVNCESFDLI